MKNVPRGPDSSPETGYITVVHRCWLSLLSLHCFALVFPLHANFPNTIEDCVGWPFLRYSAFSNLSYFIPGSYAEVEVCVAELVEHRSFNVRVVGSGPKVSMNNVLLNLLVWNATVFAVGD